MNGFNTILGLLLLVLFSTVKQAEVNTKWDEIYSIINNMDEPSFPDKQFKITDFGAVPDGQTLNTEAINKAINTCSEQGGGTVLVTKGEFLTGAVHLKSNVNLHVEEGATLQFSTEPKDYLPLVQTRWEGNDCYNYSPFIYANGQTNFAITGKGTIDGQANRETWWPWAGFRRGPDGKPAANQNIEEGRPMLRKWDSEQVPLKERQMGEGHWLRPQLINFIYCKNVKIEDVTLVNSPFWVTHPLLSENIIVRGITVNSHGPNNDGCDPESCKNVLIEDCIFNTGDDCIALKSGRNYDGRRANVPIENVLVRNCQMKDGHGGVVMGSEISGGCKNIFAENCDMNSPALERAIRMKTNNLRGGVTDGVYVRNLKIGQVREAVIKMNCAYDPREGQGDFPPVMKNVYVSNVTSEKSQFGLSLIGLEGENCIENVVISDCNFSGVARGNRIEYVKNLKFNNFIINGEKVE